MLYYPIVYIPRHYILHCPHSLSEYLVIAYSAVPIRF